jgi:hypothetical protein
MLLVIRCYPLVNLGNGNPSVERDDNFVLIQNLFNAFNSLLADRDLKWLYRLSIIGRMLLVLSFFTGGEFSRLVGTPIRIIPCHR